MKAISSKGYIRNYFVEKIKIEKFGFQVGKSVILCQYLKFDPNH